MARSQSAALDRKKLMADPIMVTTIVVLITFLTLFILYPLAILLVDSFVGDGSFGFCGAELETAARLGLKIVYVLFNNGAFGWIRGTQRVHSKAEITENFRRFTDFAEVDYVKFAESMGIRGYRVGGMKEFEEVFKKCLAADGPSLINVPLPPEDRQLPPGPGWAAAKIAKDEDMKY